jgi:hypothetical protein
MSDHDCAAVSDTVRADVRWCADCGLVRIENPEDEICPWCWRAANVRANRQRQRRIAEGWTVDDTGAIHPPNNNLTGG